MAIRDRLYKRLFELRERQANCPVSQRAEIEHEISKVMEALKNAGG